MDMTNTTGWWTCSGCGADAELPALDTAGFRVTCPDCDAAMVEQWCWETAATSSDNATAAGRHREPVAA